MGKKERGNLTHDWVLNPVNLTGENIGKQVVETLYKSNVEGSRSNVEKE